MNELSKKEILHRLSIAAGHLEKVRKMVETSEYCPDIIHQSGAVQAALKKVDEAVLKRHLHTCVLKDLDKRSKENEILVEEVVDLFRKKN